MPERVHRATSRLAAPPSTPRRHASTSSCRTTRPRVAPSESRTAISMARLAPRASSRLAMLARAISRTRAVSAKSSVIGVFVCLWTVLWPRRPSSRVTALALKRAMVCSLIANLLLARGANRAMEMAVRLSLGATRGRVVRQLLVEACILALLGGGASLLVARWTLSGIGAIVPAEEAAMVHLGLQPAMLIFTALVSVVTGLAFGMFPALHSTRSDLVTTIRANAGQLTGARTAARFRNGLVVAQIALSMALLVSAGLFIKSLVNITRGDLGLNPDRVITFTLSPKLNGYGNARSQVLFQRAEDELRALPGVTAVSSADVGVLAGNNRSRSVSVEGFRKGPDTDDGSHLNE